MASIMDYWDAGSFTSAYVFELGNKVKLMVACMEPFLKISSIIGDMYEVMLDQTQLIIMIRVEELTQFETESETKSKCRSTSKPK